MMRPEDIGKLLRVDEFVPLRIGLADGRSILVRHPDQGVVADRHLLLGLAKIERSRPLATPAESEAIARDWLIVNLVQITTIEPREAKNGKPRVRRTRRK